MASKSITIREDVYQELKKKKSPGQSFSGLFIENFDLEVEA